MKFYLLYLANLMILSCSVSEYDKLEDIKAKMPKVIERLKNKYPEETIPKELYDFKNFNLKN